MEVIADWISSLPVENINVSFCATDLLRKTNDEIASI